MCVIDWSAIAEWLSALGTIGAVLAALYLARRDHRDQLQRERHEAKILAMLLETDLLTIRARADALAWEIDEDRTGGIVFALIDMDPNVRQDIARKATDFPVSTLESVAARLHVLPVAASEAILLLLSAVRELRLAGTALGDMSRTQALTDLDGFLPQLQTQLQDLQQRARTAITACENVISSR